MSRAPFPEYQRVFRFILEGRLSEFETVDETFGSGDYPRREQRRRQVAASEFRWEGPHLVMIAGMQVDEPSLFERVTAVVDMDNSGRVPFRVRLFRADGTTSRVWELHCDQIQDRGFLFMNAVADEIAMEAICFVNARLVEIE